MKLQYLIFTIGLCGAFNTTYAQPTYHMPEETEVHEGTWLQWPHQYTYGVGYRNSLDQTWLDMTAALVTSENVHIVAYNDQQKIRITGLIQDAGIPMTNIDFYVIPNDDVWIRDNGPMFVYDSDNELKVIDWGFNGWGNDAAYTQCNTVPASIGGNIGTPVVDANEVVLEGGAIEHDGRGTLMATRSSVTHTSRNPGLTEQQIEDYFYDYMGIENVIWLDGLYGEEITDMHIDGVMKFANSNTIVTMSNSDLLEWGLIQSDINILMNAKDVNGADYNFVEIPLTQNNVSTLFGTDLGFKGCYANYYIANTVVLVPNYADPNDAIANNIIQSIYPNRTVIGINCQNLYENGGMVHCVTQQQPVALSTRINETDQFEIGKVYPNPVQEVLNVQLTSNKKEDLVVRIVDNLGKQMLLDGSYDLIPGDTTLQIPIEFLSPGVYTCEIWNEDGNRSAKRFLVVD